jgi:nitronate monooxygenase
MEQRGATLEELSPLISGDKTVMLYRDGDIDNGVPFVGQVVELITELKSCREVIDEIISGAQQIVSKLAISTGKA